MIFIAIILIVTGGVLLMKTNTAILPAKFTFTTSNGVHFQGKVKIRFQRYKNLGKREIIQADAKIYKILQEALALLHSNEVYSESVRRMAFIRKNILSNINAFLPHPAVKSIDIIDITRNNMDAPRLPESSSSGAGILKSGSPAVTR